MQIAVFPPWDHSTAHPLDATDCVGTQVHTYVRKKFRDGSGTEHEVYFHDSIKDPMEALIKGYRYHRNKRPKRYTVGAIRKFFGGQPPYNFSSVSSAPRYDIVNGQYVKKDIP